jgi:putative ABC transport system ATP-binding protein
MDDAGMSISTQTYTAARAVEATKVYGLAATAVVALDEVTVDLPTGRFTAIMGPSGSGKSTLVHCLAGLDSLTEGRVFVGDVELGTLSDSSRSFGAPGSASCSRPSTWCRR